MRRSRGPGWEAMTASTGLMGIWTVDSLACGWMLSDRKGVLRSHSALGASVTWLGAAASCVWPSYEAAQILPDQVMIARS